MFVDRTAGGTTSSVSPWNQTIPSSTTEYQP
jgi:hypothetical protein